MRVVVRWGTFAASGSGDGLDEALGVDTRRWAERGGGRGGALRGGRGGNLRSGEGFIFAAAAVAARGTNGLDV
jgi:hypothetical protein